MTVHLFTTTFNNESTIKDFIDFYKSRIPSVYIHIYDNASTDKTIEIAKENGCEVRNFSDFYQTKDIWKNNCWKHIPADCVVICNINEYIDITPNIFKNCSLVLTKGYDIADINNLNTDTRNPQYDKFCIFDPKVIKETNFEGNSCNPLGFIRVGETQPNLYHLTKLK